MHVVLSGYYGFHNSGDEAILFSIIQTLRELKPDIIITVLSNDPSFTEETYGVEAVDRWKLAEVNSCLKDADGLISGGGSLLQDATGLKSVPYYTGIMQLAKWNKTPMFVYAQGMGPINHWLSKWLTRMIVSKADRITVRDQASRNLLEAIGVNGAIDIVPDPVLGLDASCFSSPWLERVKEPFIAVSVREWPTAVQFKQMIAKSLDQLAGRGYAAVFVPMHGEEDAVVSREVAGYMQEPSFIAPSVASIEETIAIIGASELLVGMRLHALIFAAIGSVPFVGISYDPKIDAFVESLDQQVAVDVMRDGWDSETLNSHLDRVLENVDTFKSQLEERLDSYRSEARDTARAALELFGGKR